MTSWLYAHHTVIGPPERLADRLRADVRTLLLDSAGGTGSAIAVDGSFVIRVGGPLLGLPVSKAVRVTTGVATEVDRVEPRLRIPLRWEADPARHAFPTFDGALELAALTPRASDLILVGNYTPPLGPLGAVTDGMGLYGVAHDAGEGLVTALADRLEQAERMGAGVPQPEARPPSAPLQVGDLMTADPLVLDADLPLRTAALLLHHFGVHGAPVVDGHGDLIGVLSEADLLEKDAGARYGFGRAVDDSWRRRQAHTAGEACSRPARVTHREATVHDAARVMLDARVARLVVVDGSRVSGILTRSDVLRALLRTDATLQAAVDGLLEEMGQAEVRARVEWGRVALEGEVSLRSAVTPLVERIRAVDGVTEVNHELRWRDDDVTVYAETTW